MFLPFNPLDLWKVNYTSTVDVELGNLSRVITAVSPLNALDQIDA